MRIKLDECVPTPSAAALSAAGHDVDTAETEHLLGQPDERIRAAAAREGRFLITQDVGVADRRTSPPGTHPGILLLRLRDPSQRALQSRLTRLFEEEDTASWAGCLVVATDHRIRVRRT